MKTLLLLIAIVFASRIHSQIILSYTPEDLCPGDTVCVKIYNPSKSPFFFNVSSNNGTEPLMIWYEVYPEIDEADTTSYCFEVPENLPCGKAYIGINLVSQFNLHINCDCGAVNVPEYNLENIVPVIYYDLCGNRLEPRRGELLIQQSGAKRKKIIIQ